MTTPTPDDLDPIEDRYFPPFAVLPVPIDHLGRGPVEESQAVRTVWQVWDAACQTVGEYSDRREAANECRRRNLMAEDRGGGS